MWIGKQATGEEIWIRPERVSCVRHDPYYIVGPDVRGAWWVTVEGGGYFALAERPTWLLDPISKPAATE